MCNLIVQFKCTIVGWTRLIGAHAFVQPYYTPHTYTQVKQIEALVP